MNQKYSKEEILLTGIYLLRRQGYHHTGINDILRECGIPKGSFYNFFRSKEDFALQCLELYGRQIYLLMEQYLEDIDIGPLGRIQRYYQVTIKANEEEGMRYGCLLNNLSIEMAGYNDGFAELADKIYRQWMDLLSDCIGQAQDLGEVQDYYPAPLLAEYLHHNFYGAMARGKVMRSTQPLQVAFSTSIALMTAEY